MLRNEASQVKQTILIRRSFVPCLPAGRLRMTIIQNMTLPACYTNAVCQKNTITFAFYQPGYRSPALGGREESPDSTEQHTG